MLTESNPDWLSYTDANAPQPLEVEHMIRQGVVESSTQKAEYSTGFVIYFS